MSIDAITIGSIFIDHIFNKIGEDNIYSGSYIGGSTVNIALNLQVKYKVNTSIIGWIGGKTNNVTKDIPELAINELRECGVSTNNIYINENRPPIMIYQETYHDKHTVKHKYGKKCQVCQNVLADQRIADEKYEDAIHVKNIEIYRHAKVAFIDKLNDSRIHIYEKIASINDRIRLIIDIGHIGNIRNMENDELYNMIRYAKELFINENVIRYIARRAGTDINGIINDIYDKTNIDTVIIKMGRKGLNVYRSKNIYTAFNAIEYDEPVFSEGAGDLLVAAYIYYKHIKNHNLNAAIKNAISDLNVVMEQMGAIAHLNCKSYIYSKYRKYIGINAKDIKKDIKDEGINNCPICGRESQADKRIIEYYMRINSISNNNKIKDSITRIRKYINNNDSDRYITIATGNSYPAAVLAKKILIEKGYCATTLYPYEYIQSSIEGDKIIIFTYSGKTKEYEDILNTIINKARRGYNKKRIMIITGKSNSLIYRRYKGRKEIELQEVSYELLKNKEKGFVSMTSALMPSILFTLANEHNTSIYKKEIEKIVENIIREDDNMQIDNIYKSITENGIVEIYWDSYSYPAALDLESKLLESGLAVSILHEYKNYSHGRFMLRNIIKNEIPKIYIIGEANSYWSRLISTNMRSGGMSICLREKYTHYKYLNSIINTTKIFLALAKRGLENNRDIIKPVNIPKNGIELYKMYWEDK